MVSVFTCHSIEFLLGKVEVSKISGETVRKWFRLHFKDTKIQTHITDYCNVCFQYYNQLVSYRQKKQMFEVSVWFYILFTQYRKVAITKKLYIAIITLQIWNMIMINTDSR